MGSLIPWLMVVNCTQSALQHLAGVQGFLLLPPFFPGTGDNGLEQESGLRLQQGPGLDTG